MPTKVFEGKEMAASLAERHNAAYYVSCSGNAAISFDLILEVYNGDYIQFF